MEAAERKGRGGVGFEGFCSNAEWLVLKVSQLRRERGVEEGGAREKK